MLNKVLLMGNLTRDPELRYLGSGTAVCEFGLATNRRFKRSNGEMGEETCFVNITVWGRQGENCNQYLKKGRSVFVEGRLKFDSWEGQDGQKRNKLSVVAENVRFMSRGERSDEAEVSDFGSDYRGGGPEEPADAGEGVTYDDNVPF